jgi:DNA-binding NtrC family response regulator
MSSQSLLVHSGPSKGLLGASPEIEKLRTVIKSLSHSSVPVLITGETGTGKELFARAIHDGDRRRGPFVPVDCGALPEALMESEMFGHERGAFTGAHVSSPGLLVSAEGGTIFLDEVGELSLQNQVKLLRALQEKEVRPVGSCRTRSINVRVVAASNRNLSEEVAARRFRNDLYFRLAVVCITVPPLRVRRGDTRLLANHFLREFGNGARTISPDAMAAMEAYDWPGNVRELEHCIEAGCALAEEEVIRFSDLPEAIKKSSCARMVRPPGDLALSTVEKITIETAMEQMAGNVVKAARELGIGKTTLYRKLKEYKISDSAAD